MKRLSTLTCILPIALGLLAPAAAQAACPIPTWSQFAENQDSGGSGYTAPTYYYTTTFGICDNDPDLDYVLVFKGNFYNCDPDGIRYSNGGYLFNGDLKIVRPVTSDDDVHLCIGDGTVAAYGGLNNVWNALRLHYR